MKREREPTPEEFEKMLVWLDSNRDKAGEKFSLIKTRLSRVFISRGCLDAESLADEVMNRVTVRIDAVKQTYPEPLRCCLGFVDNVHHEYLRDEKKRNAAVRPPTPRPADELEREDECLRECMRELTAAEQSLLRNYFQLAKETRVTERKKLAQELGLSPNALRCQAHRLRKRLRLRLHECLERT